MSYSLDWIGQAKPQETLEALTGKPLYNPYKPLKFWFCGQAETDGFIKKKDELDRSFLYDILDVPTLRHPYEPLKFWFAGQAETDAFLKKKDEGVGCPSSSSSSWTHCNNWLLGGCLFTC